MQVTECPNFRPIESFFRPWPISKLQISSDALKPPVKKADKMFNRPESLVYVQHLPNSFGIDLPPCWPGGICSQEAKNEMHALCCLLPLNWQ